LARSTEETSRFGIDHKTGKLAIGRWRITMPQSRAARIGIGAGLIVGGCLGFLPILGFWMIPLGALVLSHDLPFARRMRQRWSVRWAKRRQKRDSPTKQDAEPAAEHSDVHLRNRLLR